MIAQLLFRKIVMMRCFNQCSRNATLAHDVLILFMFCSGRESERQPNGSLAMGEVAQRAVWHFSVE
jgi:hypothetical protein